jgi:transcription initiation factor IIE alpha subunit
LGVYSFSIYVAKDSRSRIDALRIDTHEIRRKLFYCPLKQSVVTATHLLLCSKNCTKQSLKASKGTEFNCPICYS